MLPAFFLSTAYRSRLIMIAASLFLAATIGSAWYFSAFFAVSAAQAGEWAEGRDNRGGEGRGQNDNRDRGDGSSGGGGWSGSGGGSGGGNSSGGGGSGGGNWSGGNGSPGVSWNNGSGSGHQSRGEGTTVSYDAGRNMVRLQLPLHLGAGHKEESFSNHHNHISFAPYLAGSGTQHSDKTNFLHLASTGDSHEKKALELLEKAVNPVESRYRHAIQPLPGRTTTVVTKTKLGLGTLSFSPVEVLGVGLDAQSVAAAELLGFKAQSSSPAMPEGTHIVRFLVPPTVDAVRGQELLSKRFPGHRFELNKIYRIYRAAARDGSGTNKQEQQPPTACPPD
ncbi:MAG: hypothetical protein WBX25_05330, partial [Rhodomicrobium sp.]